ncbi:MAG: hypothetical protein Fur002_18110 [Anaerolineales bacterium]
MKTKWISLIVLLALIFVPLRAARAQSPDGGDIVRVGEDFTLKSGETVSGDVVVIGGNLTIEKDAAVSGSVVVVGGSANIAEDTAISGDAVVVGGNLSAGGKVSGNMVIIGGNAAADSSIGGDVVTIGGQTSLSKTAVVNGNAVNIGGKITSEEGAQIKGDTITNTPRMEPPAAPNVPNRPDAPRLAYFDNPLWEVGGAFARALAIAAIAMLLALFFQPQMERVSAIVIRQPFVAGSFGLMAFVLALLGMVILSVTIILIPVAFLVALAMPLIWLFGVISIGSEVGQRFTAAIGQTWSPVLSAGFGSFLFALVLGFVNMVDCLGFFLVFLVSLLAFGGALMTWFNARPPAKPAAAEIAEVPPAA